MEYKSEWLASGFSDHGEWEKLRSLDRSNEEVSGSLALELVTELFDGVPPRTIEHLHKELDAAIEFNTPIPGLDSVKHWGNALITELDEKSSFSVSDNGSLIYQKNPRSDGKRAIWDGQTIVVIKVPYGVKKIHIEYTPNTNTVTREEMMRYGVNSEVASYFEWRGYFGSNSAVIRGFQRLKDGFRQTCEIACGETGFIVGTITRIAGEKKDAPDSDEMFKALQNRDQNHWISKKLPELSSPNVLSAPATILVHGTYSTCSAAFKDIPQEFLERPNTIRFEHDTFRAIQENANDLSVLIAERFERQELLLVAHSRGGLVARLAILKLRKRGFDLSHLRLVTFGTPHEGTPIAQSALTILPVLNPLISTFSPRAGLLSAAIERFRVGKSTPQGIADMVPNSPFISILNDADFCESNLTDVFGGNFEIDGVGHGCGPAFKGKFGYAAFGEANDLVVPLSSALAGNRKARQFRLKCSHFDFFTEPDVRYFLAKEMPNDPDRMWLKQILLRN